MVGPCPPDDEANDGSIHPDVVHSDGEGVLVRGVRVNHEVALQEVLDTHSHCFWLAKIQRVFCCVYNPI